MLDLTALGTIPRRAAAVLLFATPALALWAWLPSYDGSLPDRMQLPESAPDFRTLDAFAKDRALVAATAQRYDRKLVPPADTEKRAAQINELHGLYAMDFFVVNLDQMADELWHRGNYTKALGMKLGVFKNLLLKGLYQGLGAPEDYVLHGSVAGLFLVSGFGLFRLTRHG